MQLQKEVKSDPKQPSCRKKFAGHCEKRCEIQGGGQEMVVMVLIMTIQVNLVPNL